MEAKKLGWKDTVMRPEEMGELIIHPGEEVQDVVAKAQAEITWPIAEKAGVRKGYSAGKIDGQYTNHKRHGKKMVQARQEGRREVVEWIESHSELHAMPYLDYECAWLDGQRSFYEDELQAKLKEWGL